MIRNGIECNNGMYALCKFNGASGSGIGVASGAEQVLSLAHVFTNQQPCSNAESWEAEKGRAAELSFDQCLPGGNHSRRREQSARRAREASHRLETL